MRLGGLPIGIAILFGLFLAGIAYLVTASFARRTLPTFEPSPVAPRPLGVDTTVDEVLTVDARDGEAWQFVDLDRRSVVTPPDTASWDLAFRRFRIIAAGEIADLGTVPFDSGRTPPPGDFVGNRNGADTVNPAINRWYRYDFLSHLLESKRHVYAIRTTDQRIAKVTVLSYYCPGLSAGCVTFRYVYPLRSEFPPNR